MRVKLNLKKLKDAEPQFVSLVRRSANQIPFRIQKAAGDDNMATVDLSSFSRIMSGAKGKKTATVESIVVRKSDKFEEVKSTIVKAGYSVDKAREHEDGTVSFDQTDTFAKSPKTVRMSEDLVLVMKDFEPWEADIASFSDQLGLDGYYDGLITGSMALRSIFSKIVYAAESHEDMVALITKALDDFKAYALGLAQAIPPSCYSMDDELQVVQKSAKEEVCKNCGGGGKKMTHKAGCKSAVQKEETAPVTEPSKENTVAEATPPVVPPAVTEPPKTEVAKTEAPPPVPEMKVDFSPVLEAIKGLGTTVETVQKNQASLEQKFNAQLEALGLQVKEVVAKTAENEAKLKTVVAAPPGAGDSAPKATVVKSDDDDTGMGTGVWDSAMARPRYGGVRR